MKTLTAKWTGIRPLLMHNGDMADPTNPFVIAIKEITKKGSKKMTISDHEKRNRLEWEGGLYWDEKDGLIIPADNIERCIQVGAQKSRKGKDVQAAVLSAEPHAKIDYKGPKQKDKLYASTDPLFQNRKGVSINGSRVIRVRPLVPTGWSIIVKIEYDDTVVDEADIIKAMQDAGSLIGLGDWRPKFGRFTVEILA